MTTPETGQAAIWGCGGLVARHAHSAARDGLGGAIQLLPSPAFNAALAINGLARDDFSCAA